MKNTSDKNHFNPLRDKIYDKTIYSTVTNCRNTSLNRMTMSLFTGIQFGFTTHNIIRDIENGLCDEIIEPNMYEEER
jgi:hypothetical protein